MEGFISREIRDPSPEMYEQVECLHSVFPGKDNSAISYERYKSLLDNDDFYLLGVFDGPKLVGMLSLVGIRTLYRTAILYEESVVTMEYRGKGIGKELDRFAIEFVTEYTDATRIEGTVNKENKITWYIHMGCGFFDRQNKTFLKVIKRE